MKRVLDFSSKQGGLGKQGDNSIEGRNHINPSQCGLSSQSLEPMRAPMKASQLERESWRPHQIRV